MHVTKQELRELGLTVFRKIGAPENVALSVIDALVYAEMDGIPSHGFSRIPFYADQAQCGKVRLGAVPACRKAAPCVLKVDAGYGFAFPAIDEGLTALTSLCKTQGMAMLGVTHSHHCGVLGYFAERLAREGLISLIMANTPAAMSPWGGCRPTYGTNPIAFGCPHDPEPIIVDLSLSSVARGKVMLASKKGTRIPEGWALDRSGNPTTDPEEALKGTMLPAGGAKGAALALMVEILTACLNGAHDGFQASSLFSSEGEPPNLGQTFIAVNPACLNENFQVQVAGLCRFICEQPGTRLPGERRFQVRKRNLAEGIELDDRLYGELIRRADGGQDKAGH